MFTGRNAISICRETLGPVVVPYGPLKTDRVSDSGFKNRRCPFKRGTEKKMRTRVRNFSEYVAVSSKQGLRQGTLKSSNGHTKSSSSIS